MYCPLDDAFPQNKQTQPASCWSGNAPCFPEKSETQKGVKSKSKKPTVQAISSKQAAQIQQQAIQQHQQRTTQQNHHNQHDVCLSAIKHCMSCTECQRMMSVHLKMQDQRNPILGAQVSEAASFPPPPPNAMTSLPSSSRKTQPGFLNQSITPNSTITWGVLLVILAVSAFFLLFAEKLRSIFRKDRKNN